MHHNFKLDHTLIQKPSAGFKVNIIFNKRLVMVQIQVEAVELEQKGLLVNEMKWFVELGTIDLGGYTGNKCMVKVRRGDPAVLQCKVDPGDTLLSVTWKVRLYNSSCVISYKIEEDNTKTSYSSCSTRMRSDHLSLTINNTEISDEGTYTCEVMNDKDDTFFRDFSLQVLVQPTTYLKLNSDGSPECGAIGGNPPAEISWIPHSDDKNTTKLEDPDGTWSVISTIRRSGINGTSVTCVVSHPMFVNPWKADIILNNYIFRVSNNWRIIITVMFIVLMGGLLLCVKIRCQIESIRSFVQRIHRHIRV
ncbi:cell surface glycoprotein CD200 receptor 1-B-like [Phyllobates terribilis]|uniref:cell surface glycoprotein CD200 receptor 1-B-like n=1 Tax=Phyllobates terribilis TaxID=111132 RepID=UPI003CCAA86D